MSKNNTNEPDHQGVQESQQDRRQDEVAKQRPGQKDQQIEREHTRRPQPAPPSK